MRTALLKTKTRAPITERELTSAAVIFGPDLRPREVLVVAKEIDGNGNEAGVVKYHLTTRARDFWSQWKTSPAAAIDALIQGDPIEEGPAA